MLVKHSIFHYGMLIKHSNLNHDMLVFDLMGTLLYNFQGVCDGNDMIQMRKYPSEMVKI